MDSAAGLYRYVRTFSYDELGRATGQALQYPTAYSGGLASSLSGAETVSATLDSLGRVTRVQNPTALGAFSFGYVGFTARLSSITNGESEFTSFGYKDASGDFRLAEIFNKRAGEGGPVNISKFNYNHDVSGQITNIIHQTDTAAANAWDYDYDLAGQLVSAFLRKADGSADLKHFDYRYDKAGNRTGDQVSTPGESGTTQLHKYTVNEINQITKREAGGALIVQGKTQNDARVSVTVGNHTDSAPQYLGGKRFRAHLPGISTGTGQPVQIVTANSSGTTTATNNYTLNVTGDAERDFVYDGNGNFLSDGLRAYTWNMLGQMLSVSNLGTHAHTEFTYNALGDRIRIREMTNATTVVRDDRLIWNGATLLAVTDAATGEHHPELPRRYFGQGMIIGSTGYLFTRDHLGSIREVLTADSSRSLVARYDYESR